MAPIRLAKRLTFDSRPLSNSMKATIGIGATIIVLFLIGIGVFIYFYQRSSRQPNVAHVGPSASWPSSLEKGEVEKPLDSDSSVASSTITPSPTPSLPPPAVLKDVPPRKPTPEEEETSKETSKRKSAANGLRVIVDAPGEKKDDETKRDSTMSLNVPPTPGKEFC